MEYLKVAGGKASPKREPRNLKSRQQQKSTMSNLKEAITQVNCGGRGGGGVNVSESTENGGVVRMKITVRKQDLRQMLEAMNKNKSKNNSPLSLSSGAAVSSVEQRLNLLRWKHTLRAHVNAGKESQRPLSWRPVLQSIPEEL